ncbi:MAG: hypothetical protein JW724_07620 [Candidatus Altiarchaeota archaeon]|nr:hypothetical protein [Candidatus Altiarchaeota archaeon]
MSPTNCPGKNGFRGDERGLGVADSPFMILAAVILMAFTVALGIYITSSFMDSAARANAVDAAETIYNAADTLSAGALDSSRTLWVKIPEGYSITFDGDVSLSDKDGIIGVPLHLSGVEVTGETLEGTGRYHLKITYVREYEKPMIKVIDIT